MCYVVVAVPWFDCFSFKTADAAVFAGVVCIFYCHRYQNTGAAYNIDPGKPAAEVSQT